ncbi:ribonuclease H-like domain-containing protein [Tanacetum coccineum]
MRKCTLLKSDASYARDHTIQKIIRKEEGKTLEEAYYTQFGAPYQPGGQYRATGPGFYQQNNGNSSYPDRRPSLEESLTKFMVESAKRHEENSNIIKEIRASTDAAIRNQRASIKTLEIQIGQISKVLQERGFKSLPNATKTNPRDQVKAISTARTNFSEIHRIGHEPYAISDSGCSLLASERKRLGSFTLPYFIRDICFDKALVDLRASELLKIAENVILDIPEDNDVPLILERPFLSTAHSKIDVFERKITLRVGDEKLVFKAQYVAYKTNVAQQFTPQKHYRLPHPNQGILGPAPAIYASQPTTLPSAFSTMPLQDPTWHMDIGASSHLNFNASNLSTIFDKRLFPSVYVGDGESIPVTNTGHSIIPSHHRPLHLHNVLVTPNIIKNLIFVRQFTRDNNCTIEFDAFGFSMKDYLTRHILLRCDGSSDLYPVTRVQQLSSHCLFSRQVPPRGINASNIRMSKLLQERGFGSLPSSTEINPRDQVKSISTAKADLSEIRRIRHEPYADVKILDTYDHSLPQKEKDPLSFTLPCFIHNICFDKALVDLGAKSVSVMPFSTYTNLGLGILSHTKLTIELADRTINQPRDTAKNVLVRIGKLIFPIDFIILDLPEDNDVPLILGRPFLSTAHSKIDVFKRKITLRYVITDLRPSLPINLMSKSFYYSIFGDKDEGKSHAGTLIDIPIFVGSFSIISGFTIIDDDDMTKDVVLGMKFCKKYASCQRIMKRFSLGNNYKQIMEDE